MLKMLKMPLKIPLPPLPFFGQFLVWWNLLNKYMWHENQLLRAAAEMEYDRRDSMWATNGRQT